ncbi:hypothetical protein FJ434_01240 [Mesorhizobium sp. B2-5-13]|uniref:hypothetical protein n=1 Tax=unclassified Mesorhizobium TaxID=325217 RepID=UPI00112AA92F|nr:MULTISPECIES: hypothetical protein [unclassified Mesorhizobium]TPJ43467.1 hypothetical protein FJ432_05950 [Mesorhizobium sp. B2-6-5]TPJ93351.1 hypothetical protein FJ434_01240 [Mesorhizobium sp. B2-5-13]TPK47564.1 hypothetical protein FJ560_17045 [Mesorhizobium sp. B2-5-5]
MTSSTPEPKLFSWTDEEADQIAKDVFDHDPFHKTRGRVPPSLLSAEDIVGYVEKTAMISPFHATPEKLKHASYEDRIGKNAYIYDRKGIQRIPLKDGWLRVPANEIVFVESRVTFRLPRYIAARFNLQIKHVHRGLLLGTGPLVDPGFRGRLLIPLHNLTSEDYYIHEDDGFIWLEFTRTTYNQDRKLQYGYYPKYKEISDGLQWLHKAAYDGYLDREVAIRSSIKPFVERVEKKATKALKGVRWVQGVGAVGALSLIITFGIIFMSEIYSNRSFMQSAYNLLLSQGGEPVKAASGFGKDISQVRGQIEDLQTRVKATRSDLETRIEALEIESASLRKVLRNQGSPERPSDKKL